MAVNKRGTARQEVDYLNHPDTVIVRPDLGDLTVGQVEEVEELIDAPLWETIGDQTKKQGRVQRAIAFVIRKSQDPEFTWDQAANLRLMMVLPQADDGDGEEQGIPPTNGRGSSTRSRSANTSRSSTGKTSTT